MRISSFCVLFFCCLSFVSPLKAQDILRSLESSRPGEGTVTIHQDSRLRDMITSNHTNNVPVENTEYVGAGESSSSVGENRGRRTFKTNGYRIQVYAGNNSRQAREEAYKKASQVRDYLPGVPVYTYFLSPRWLCRVGDFRSIEEADAAMRKLKATPYFKEVTIVREQVNIHY